MKKFIIALIGTVVMTFLGGLVFTSCNVHQHYDDEDYVEYSSEDSAFVYDVMNGQSSYVYENEELFVKHVKNVSEHDHFVLIVSTMQQGTIRAVLARLKTHNIPLTEKEFIKEYISQQSIYDAVDNSLKDPYKELDTAPDIQNPTKQEKEDSTCEQ